MAAWHADWREAVRLNNLSPFYCTSPDSGYSVDNLAPAIPDSLSASPGASGITLNWRSVSDEDFAYYAIYRSTQSGFDPGAAEIYTATIDTVYEDVAAAFGTNYYYRVSAFDFNGNEGEYSEEVSAIVTGINENGKLIPTEYSLMQNPPNPCNPVTVLHYALPKPSDISLVIYNIMGQEIMRWEENNVQSGYYSKVWNSTNKFGVAVGSGVYLYRLVAENFVETRKMVLLK